MTTDTSLAEICTVKREDIPETVTEEYSDAERDELKSRIKQLLKEQNAVMVAHYYTDPDLQLIADATVGYVSDSLDIGCPIDAFSEFCDQHPDRTVVVYANTSAEVKARSDWVVTSGSALDIINHLQAKGEKFIWAPDKYLGDYIQKQTGADMLLWQGACIVHEEFKGIELAELKKQHPDDKVLVHPESPASVIELADVVSSTTGIIKAAVELDAKEFIVATDKGIFHKMQEAAPDKIFIEAPTSGKGATCISCGHCPWMAMNSLRKVVECLETGSGEIHIDPELGKRARVPIQRLLDFAKVHNQQVLMSSDA